MRISRLVQNGMVISNTIRLRRRGVRLDIHNATGKPNRKHRTVVPPAWNTERSNAWA
ncbi:hypothetical protein D9M71_847310 [compost metagenome]